MHLHRKTSDHDLVVPKVAMACVVGKRAGIATLVALVLALLSLLGPASAYSANFFCTVRNERMSLDFSDYDLPASASYIVGVKDLNSKASVLEDLAVEFDDWKPQYEYQSMSMFSGLLSPQQVSWLLHDDRIAYCECDGFVKVARKKDVGIKEL